jgi:hypothetical protein
MVERRKNRGDEPIQVIIHIYKETPCITILNKNVIFFFLLQEGGTGPALGRRGGW